MFQLLTEVKDFIPTAGGAIASDPTGLYLAEQNTGLWRLDLDNRELKLFLDLSQPFQDMKTIAAKKKWKKGPFRHLRPKDFQAGLADERGVLGFAFHPRYNENGRLYVYYSTASDRPEFDHYNLVSEFTIDHDNRLVREKTLLRLPYTQFNHNGGCLAFGPRDGYLYIGVGDGGGRDDAHGAIVAPGEEISLLDVPHEISGAKAYLGNAQDLTTYQGSILRIDVDHRSETPDLPYSIPPTNPLVNAKVEDFPPALRMYFAGESLKRELWAWGLRNPWKFSFGPEGRLFVADVGQDLVEEIDIVEGGGNYGWRIMEGHRIFHRPLYEFFHSLGLVADIIRPILTHGRDNNQPILGNSVIGGYVYQGSDIPRLREAPFYIYGDYKNSLGYAQVLYGVESREGRWGSLEDPQSGHPGILGVLQGESIHSFAQGPYKELYILSQVTRKDSSTQGASKSPHLPTMRLRKIISAPVDFSKKRLLGATKIFQPLFDTPTLSFEQASALLHRARTIAQFMTTSQLRRSEEGQASSPKIHVAVLGRNGDLWTESMADAWRGSLAIAIAKANTALSFSSDENALTSRSVGFLSQPGQDLWQIGTSMPGELVEFPGGVPLYQNKRLVGALGVSGDAIDVDERIAGYSSFGYEPSPAIRIDTVTQGKIPYLIESDSNF
jgi:glucose/arabinose dehydrogenase/uncharacterized protein GlcG (DUF336 family)